MNLRTLAKLAHVAHGVAILRALAGMGISYLVARDGTESAPALASWILLGLALVIVATLVLAVRSGVQAGLRTPSVRLAGALIVWAGVVLAAQLRGAEDARTFTAPAAMATDLAFLAWCSLLGRGVRLAGAPDARLLRLMAMAWLLLHLAIQLAPLPLMVSIGLGPIAVVTVAATVVPFGAAFVDAIRIDRATRGERAAPQALGALAEATSAPADEPWRPGA